MTRTINEGTALYIYRMMIEYQQTEGFSMTTREIANELGLVSNSDVAAHVRWLVDNGYAKQHGKQTRALTQEQRDENT
jgi:SOS-response transcriptional repressor LexA